MRIVSRSLLVLFLLAFLASTLTPPGVRAEDEEEDFTLPVAESDLGSHKEAGRTDENAVEREEEAIKLDGLSVAELKQLRDSSEKKVFAAEVDR